MSVSHAPLGGGREALLATLVATRLALSADGPAALSQPVRAQRATAARQWLGALTLTAGIRKAIAELLDASISGDHVALRASLTGVIEATGPHLNRKARSELERLAHRFSGT